MSEQNVISFSKVYKSFSLDKEVSLKHKILHLKKNRKEKTQIIKNLSFDIKNGETVGLFGPNGSGKTTILRLTAKILPPDSGTISVSGKVAPVIELGSGLHPELSGQDNILLYASILGIDKQYLSNYFKKIVSFSGLSTYMNVPLKNYSSGMRSRLAFSVAIFSQADIFLLDEVFAVGDLLFKDKTMRMLKKIKKNKTILLASHDLELMQSVCDRILILDNGKIVNNENEMLISLIQSMPLNKQFTCKVVSNSMYPLIKRGNLIIIKKVSFNQIKPGDIIAFILKQMPQIIVHRVIDIMKNGKKICITRGDNTTGFDKWEIDSSNYLGKVIKIGKNKI